MGINTTFPDVLLLTGRVTQLSRLIGGDLKRSNVWSELLGFHIHIFDIIDLAVIHIRFHYVIKEGPSDDSNSQGDWYHISHLLNI